jgi:type VI secretion system protein
MKRTASTALRWLALLGVCWLSGCSLFSSAPKPVKPGWDSLTLVASHDVNDNTALAVDVVFIKDKAVADGLLKMPATTWFAARAGLQSTFPEGLTVVSLEIIPDQTIRVPRQRYQDEKAWLALAFANYATPGEHRQQLVLDHGGYLLQLGAQELLITGAGPGR